MTAPNHRPPKPRRINSELDKEFFSVYEVAEMLGFHHNTIRRMIKKRRTARPPVRQSVAYKQSGSGRAC